MPSFIPCNTDARLVFNSWKDENGATINLTLLDALRVTVFDSDSQTFLRKSENVLASPDIIRTSTGRLTWYLRPYDTQMIGDTEPGDSQSRQAYVRLAAGSERADDLTDPFTTIADSRRIVVAHPAHGLAVTESVFFETDTDVGGLDLGTQFAVDEVLDADHYAVLAHDTALTSATNQGGAVRVWVKGHAAAAHTTFAVVRNEPL